MTDTTDADVEKELVGIRDRLEGLFDQLDLGTLDELARRLEIMNEIQQRASGSAAVLVLAAAERMEHDAIETTAGWLVRKQKYSSAGSDYAGARQAGRYEIVSRVALDVASGEVRPDWRHVAEETIDLIEQSFSVGSPKIAGFRRIGLDPDEYMVSSKAGWSVSVEKGPSWTWKK